jgi:hypothetical protein
MNVAIFCLKAQCSPCVNWRFGGTYHLYLQGRKSAERLLNAGILLSWFIDPEDGGDNFLRNVGSRRTTLRYFAEDDNIPIKHVFEENRR